MASCITSQWKNYAPQAKLTVNIKSQTDTQAVLEYTLQYIASSAAQTNNTARAYTIKIGSNTITGTYDIDNKKGTYTVRTGTVTINKTTAAQTIAFSIDFVMNLTWSGVHKGTVSASSSISVAAKTSYTISYNANGGSSAPSAQTKWAGTALALSSTKPTRTGYVFQGWATSASGAVAYASGASYTANAGVTLYAVWKANEYTVTYNANGGTGAPGNQIKKYGTTLTLQSAKPERDNYNFLGWATSASGAVVYSAGASYTANAAITLYAVWELAYIAPSIYNLKVARCDPSGVESDEGTHFKVSFDWQTFCGYTWDEGAFYVYYTDKEGIEHEHPMEGYGDGWGKSSGHFEKILTLYYDGNPMPLIADISYKVEVVLWDNAYDDGVIENSYTLVAVNLLGTTFNIDFLAPKAESDKGGTAVGKPAELDGVFEVGYQTKLTGGMLPLLLGPNTNLNDVLIPNTYTGANISSNYYVNCPVTSGTFTLLVESCGEDGQIKQTYCTCSKYKPERYSRFYYQGTWGAWFWANTDEYILYENSSGSDGNITLAAALSHFRYIEIYFTDNNGKTGGYTKVYAPDGKTICLGIHEGVVPIHCRQTLYTASGTTLTPKITDASYFKINASGTVTVSQGTNYIKIVRVIGRA